MSVKNRIKKINSILSQIKNAIDKKDYYNIEINYDNLENEILELKFDIRKFEKENDL